MGLGHVSGDQEMRMEAEGYGTRARNVGPLRHMQLTIKKLCLTGKLTKALCGMDTAERLGGEGNL